MERKPQKDALGQIFQVFFTIVLSLGGVIMAFYGLREGNLIKVVCGCAALIMVEIRICTIKICDLLEELKNNKKEKYNGY